MTGPEERSERVAATPRPRREHVRRLVDAATSLLLLGLWVAMWPVPRSWLLGLAHALAPLIARLNQFRVARKNLRIIRSVHPAAWRGLAEDQLVASAVGHQLCTIVDLFKLVASSGPETIAVTTVVGWERLEALSQARRGLVLVAAHQGNWEVTGAALAARGLPVHAFYFEQLAPSLDRFLAWARARSGMRLLHRQRGLRECLRVLRQGGAVGFVADQDGSKDGIWVEFLGRLVSMPRGPYEFARHAGCPVVPLSCRRLADDSYEIVIDEPLPVEEPAEVERVCHEVVARFEARVAATPEQWQLFYDRFWLRHIPRLAELGLLERAHRETERDRLLAQSPESTGEQPERSEGGGSGVGNPSSKIGLAPGELQTLALPEVPAAEGQLVSPEAGGAAAPNEAARLPPQALLRLAYLFYLPILLVAAGWMAFRGRWEAWLWNDCGPGLAVSLVLAVVVSLLTVFASRFFTRHFTWGEQLEAAFRDILGPIDASTAVRLAAISALAEEALFRGALQPELGLFWTSLLFGLVHFPAEPRLRPWTLFAFLVGACLGILYDFTGGLLAPVLAHFLINALNLAWLGRSP